MKRESKYAQKKSKHGPAIAKFGHQIGKLNMPENAPKNSWWMPANGHFYEEAKAQLPRMLVSKIHHQIVAIRIVGHFD